MIRLPGHIALAVAMASPAAGGASVLSVSDTAMTIERSIAVSSPPSRLWTLLGEPARWWSPGQSWSGDPRNLRLELRPGGCLCETLADSGFVEHLRVVRAEPGRMLRLTGALGPLQADALGGPLTITFAADGAGSRMTWRYVVSGAARVPLPMLAPILDTLLGEQMGRLAAVAEGRAPPDAPAPAPSAPSAGRRRPE